MQARHLPNLKSWQQAATKHKNPGVLPGESHTVTHVKPIIQYWYAYLCNTVYLKKTNNAKHALVQPLI